MNRRRNLHPYFDLARRQRRLLEALFGAEAGLAEYRMAEIEAAKLLSAQEGTRRSPAEG